MVHTGSDEQEFAMLLLTFHQYNRPDLRKAFADLLPSIIPTLDQYFLSGNKEIANQLWLLTALAMGNPAHMQIWMNYIDQGTVAHQELFLLGILYGFPTHTTGTGEVIPYGIRVNPTPTRST